MRTFNSLAELEQVVGQEVAISDWVSIDQKRVDLFADATDDHQWIHVDPERAKQGPFGGPIAHGFLTLSLLPYLMAEAIEMKNTVLGINYGLNKVRFPSPVPVGSRLRARFKLASMDKLPPQMGFPGAQFVWEVTIEREGSDKPVCVAESVTRRYG
ncbi:MAG: MaoC family dehydratase [Burkholderiaceae bacterium]